MPQDMNREVIIPRDVTGSGAPRDRSPHVPRPPGPIVASAADAAFGASPGTGPRADLMQDFAAPGVTGQTMTGPDAVRNEPGFVKH